MKRKLLALLLAVSCVLSVTACGGKEASAEVSEETEKDSKEAEREAKRAEREAAREAKKNGEEDKDSEAKEKEAEEKEAEAKEAEEKAAKEKAESALLSMQTAEKARRKKLVKDAVLKRLKAINENLDEKIEETVCNSILTDERIDAFSAMEENGEFCGDARACRELDALCMDKVIECNAKKANAAKKHFAWNDAADENDETGGVLQSLTAILD